MYNDSGQSCHRSLFAISPHVVIVWHRQCFVLSPSLFVMHPPPSQTCRHVNVFRYHRSSSACSDSDSTVHWRPLRATGPQWCLSGWGVQGLFDQSRLRRRKRQAGMSARRGVRLRVHAVCVCVTHSLARSPVLLLEKGCPLQVSWSYCLILTIFNASFFFPLFNFSNFLWFLILNFSAVHLLSPWISLSYTLRSLEAHRDNGHGWFPSAAYFHWEQPGTATSFIYCCAIYPESQFLLSLLCFHKMCVALAFFS